MSWVGELAGGEPKSDAPPPASELEGHKVLKGATGKAVSTKAANRPFLAYQQYRQKQEEDLAARKQRNKERLEKMARGEKVGPPESEELDTAQEVGVWGLIKFLVALVAIGMLLGHFITGDYLWDYQGKWRHLKTYLPSGERLLSENQLAKYDGNTENFGVYIAIDHDVYDVSSNRRTYGPGGAYEFMAGKDAARAFATGCFKEHRTHDLRGLNEKEQGQIEHWKNFFANHKDYPKVGRVVHPPIDPASPIPEDCDPKRKQERATAHEKQRKESEAAAVANDGKSHQEL
ncbi:cytochrome b5 [Hysterangium stoloniferum]|nr:cytochrome b5 [Hysterangium stoloniferum]